MVNATTGKRVDKRFHPNVRIGGYWATQDKAGVDYDARTAVYTVPHPRFKTGYSTASPNWLSYGEAAGADWSGGRQRGQQERPTCVAQCCHFCRVAAPRSLPTHSRTGAPHAAADITLIVLDYPSSKTLPRLPPFTGGRGFAAGLLPLLPPVAVACHACLLISPAYLLPITLQPSPTCRCPLPMAT